MSLMDGVVGTLVEMMWAQVLVRLPVAQSWHLPLESTLCAMHAHSAVLHPPSIPGGTFPPPGVHFLLTLPFICAVSRFVDTSISVSSPLFSVGSLLTTLGHEATETGLAYAPVSQAQSQAQHITTLGSGAMGSLWASDAA